MKFSYSQDTMNDYSKYIIQKHTTVKEALIKLNELSGNVQTLFVVDKNQVMLGTLTDGDIRRALISGIALEDKIEKVYKTNFRFIFEKQNNVEKIKKIREQGISLLPCLNKEKKLVKIINLHKKKNILPIDVILMAGGKGMRLRPLTESLPKPLLPINNKPIIDYNIENIINNGVENINVTINYLGELIEEHFKNINNSIKINCVREPKYLGTIGSVKYIKKISNDYILLMNSDLFTNIDYEDFFIYFIKNEADMAVAAVPYTVNVPYGIFDIENGNIKALKEKPSYNYYANAGIYLIKTKLLDLVPDDTFFDATDFMNKLIYKGYSVIRYPLIGYWYDIGKMEDYNRVQDLARHLSYRKNGE